MFTKSAQYYDALYHWKDYKAEAEKLDALIRQYKQSDGSTMLDVACGTGAHMPYLADQYMIEGLDLDEGLLAVARERSPQTVFYQGDMRDFNLGKQFDVVTCLFSSIGYVKTVEALQQTIANFARHTRPGGVIIVEPWFPPGFMTLRPPTVITVEEAEQKIVRMSYVTLEERLSTIHFHYLIGTIDGITHLSEEHQLGLFTVEEHTAAFKDAGLDVTFDPHGLMDRGLYIGTMPREN
ncbi:MAG: class I SAM-dependent methyltransferase [Anaerolineae bacterium]